jgi:hypothetical protein
MGPDGSLTALPALTKALAAGANGAAEVRANRTGDLLVVSERREQSPRDIFAIGNEGSLGNPVVTTAAGSTPFRFRLHDARRSHRVGSRPGSASSYIANGNGSLDVISAAAPTLQRATCWLIVTNSGRFALHGERRQRNRPRVSPSTRTAHSRALPTRA